MLFLILKNSKFNINAIEMSKVNDKSNWIKVAVDWLLTGLIFGL